MTATRGNNMTQPIYDVHWSDRLFYSLTSVAAAYTAFQTTFKTAKWAIYIFEANASFFSLPIAASFMSMTVILGKHFLYLAVALSKYAWHLWNVDKTDQLPPWNIRLLPENLL